MWILFLEPDGTVGAQQKISELEGGFSGSLDADRFGSSVASLGDLDGDGIGDLAVGAPENDECCGNGGEGAVWILFLRADGTVRHEQKIDADTGGFTGTLHVFDHFGTGLAPLGDLDGDGNPDLAVGAPGDDEGGANLQGAVYVLFLEPDGTVRAHTKNPARAAFGDPFLGDFGRSLAALGDLDGAGVIDLAAGHLWSDDGGVGWDANRGAVWLLFLRSDGSVRSELKISDTEGGFGGVLDDGDLFGGSLAATGDLDGDGVTELAVGSFADSDAGPFSGAVWMLFLVGPCWTIDVETEDDFATPLVNGQHIDTEFGRFVTLTGSGANAGLALFDSTVGGPNDPSQDPDLLVGTGNVLILQTENFPPDANDVFPRPNDDEDGGTITFGFEHTIEAVSMRLIDLDAGDGAAAIVLRDGAGEQRTYSVPSDWTGDLNLAQPGQGVLDLTTLAGQPGFGSSATAVQDVGFDPRGVIRIDVHLDGSGAVDDLLGCSTALPRAAFAVRTGSHGNPTILGTDSPPVLGTSWSAALDCSSIGDGIAIVVMRALPSSGEMTPYGELLVAGQILSRTTLAFAGGSSQMSWTIPYDPALLGLEVHVQGLCRGTLGPPRGKLCLVRGRLSNALDLVIGY